MQMLPLHRFRAELAQTLDRVMLGERVQVTRHGVAIIELRPVQPVTAPRIPSWKKQIKRQTLRTGTDEARNPVLAERDDSSY